MSKDNRDFFRAKSDWAKVKDQLLGCYLQPYVSKILMTGRPLLYVDCFAGKGMFGDGEEGSPLIAARIIEKGISASSAVHPRVKCVFLDRDYADDLRRNLFEREFISAMSGEYKKVPEILREFSDSNTNVFLYVDPYGISSLDMDFFDGLVRDFPSVELLVN